MPEQKFAPHRRDLLGGIAVLGAAAGFADRGAQAAESGSPMGDNAPTDFVKWLDSIGGKQRQMFDMPEPNQGWGLIWSWVFLATGPEAYGLPEKELGVVIVLRHNGLPLAFNNATWSKYKLGEVFKADDPASKAPATRNIYFASKEGDMLLPDASIDRLIARGVKVGACAAAIDFFSGMVAKKMGVPHEQVSKDWIAGLIPGVQVVPSGVVALNGAQSRGCGYCFAG